jgi:DNA polymerase-1
LLFEDLGLTPGRKTKTGFSTDEETLSALAEDHDVVADILWYRKNAKLMSTYLEPFVRRAAESHGLVHPCFDQISAQTGRLTTVEPNLQNIPTRDESARRIRGGFVSRFPDGVIMSADYSQIELRLLAHASGDEALVGAFNTGRDIHRFTASNLFAKREADVSDQERDFAKRVNFSVIYGMGPYSLAKELGVSFAQAQAFIAGYFAQYPKVRTYFDASKAFLEEHGYVLTFAGRMRRIPDVMSSDRALKEYALRQGANAPLQGAAADIIKKAMVDIGRECVVRGLRAKMILQIHDELLFDVPQDERVTLEILVKERMEHAAALAVPLTVNIRSGKTWLEATK